MSGASPFAVGPQAANYSKRAGCSWELSFPEPERRSPDRLAGKVAEQRADQEIGDLASSGVQSANRNSGNSLRFGRGGFTPAAFSLIEVMIALALFFMCTFAILGLTSQLLKNARVFQTKKAPVVAMVHGWYTSKTNRVTEGETTVEFSDISSDIGELYRDYYAVIYATPNEEMTNGLWNVSYTVFNRRTHQVDSKVDTFYWDPASRSRQQGALPR
jgi:hypothetical protein